MERDGLTPEETEMLKEVEERMANWRRRVLTTSSPRNVKIGPPLPVVRTANDADQSPVNLPQNTVKGIPFLVCF